MYHFLLVITGCSVAPAILMATGLVNGKGQTMAAYKFNTPKPIAKNLTRNSKNFSETPLEVRPLDQFLHDGSNDAESPTGVPFGIRKTKITFNPIYSHKKPNWQWRFFASCICSEPRAAHLFQTCILNSH